MRAELQSLQECMERLPPQQLALVRSYYATTKIRMEDLAREMSRPVAGLYKAIERARAALRTCIDQRMSDLGL